MHFDISQPVALDVIFNAIEDLAALAAAHAHSPMTPQQMINTAFIILAKQSILQHDIRAWGRLASSAQTWEAMILHFREAQDDLSNFPAPVASSLYDNQAPSHQANHVDMIADLVAQRLIDTVAPLLEPLPPPVLLPLQPQPLPSLSSRAIPSSWLRSRISLLSMPPMRLVQHAWHLLVLLTTPHRIASMVAIIVVVVVVVPVVAQTQHQDLACTAGLMELVPTPALIATTPTPVTSPLPLSPACKVAAPCVVSGYLSDRPGLS